jgi:hypothetical protein
MSHSRTSTKHKVCANICIKLSNLICERASLADDSEIVYIPDQADDFDDDDPDDDLYI